MITGFDQYTAELDHYELTQLLPAMVNSMRKHHGENSAISSTEAIKLMRLAKYKITAPRFRKIMHVIRVSGMVSGICGSSRGYFIASNMEEWVKYLTSINERLRHIQSLRDALTNQYIEFKETLR